MTPKETLDALHAALSVIGDKKKAVDQAQVTLSTAQNAYSDAVAKARDLDAQYRAHVDGLIPALNAGRR